MENQDLLAKKLEERKGLFSGVFAKRNRKLQALNDACSDLKQQNLQLQEELEKKEKIVDNLRNFLNEINPDGGSED